MEDDALWNSHPYGTTFSMEQSSIWRNLLYGTVVLIAQPYQWNSRPYGATFSTEHSSRIEHDPPPLQ
jgi:hypothetical protein